MNLKEEINLNNSTYIVQCFINISELINIIYFEDD